MGDLDPETYDGVFLAGGHGTMWDFPDSADLGRLIARVHGAGRIGARLHGPAGLIAAKRGRRPPDPRRSAERLHRTPRAAGRAPGYRPVPAGKPAEGAGRPVRKALALPRLRGPRPGFVTGQNPRSSRAVADRMLSVMAPGTTEDAA
ncbi:MAG: hypothetical protein U5L08_06500 [Xanthomonadales bacterium]|nr:hypothetical protein [Xanthomonadales bacterium]